jgi:glutamine---fructose-6-phosphate transaminase (isomerizing)
MTHMADEIRQTPEVLARFLAEGTQAIRAAAKAMSRARPSWVAITARGTSDHAAVYARYLIEAVLGIPVILVAPSINTVYERRSSWSNGMLISISQSGQSPDLLAVLEAAKHGGRPTIAITNNPQSPLAKGSDFVVDCRAGEEKAVAATKTYVSSLAAIAALVEGLQPTDALDTAALPEIAQHTIEVSDRWVAESGVVDAFIRSVGSLTIARGYNYATALEVALKLIETSRRFVIGYSAADIEHGPMVLARDNIPVLFFESPGPMGFRTRPLRQRLMASGGNVWTVTAADGVPAESKTLVLPIDVSDELSPIPMVLPGQLLAESAAKSLGYDPDFPRGLTKVTQTL